MTPLPGPPPGSPKPGGFPRPGDARLNPGKPEGFPKPSTIPKPAPPASPTHETVELTYDESGRPITGISAIDEALQRVGDLSERELGEHADVLTAAHEALARVLDEATGRQ